MTEVRALIVDDSSVMRKIVERSLRQAGLDPLVVHEAGSGIEGLDILRTTPVDLILTDINMPTMDGLEFVRQIEALHLAEVERRKLGRSARVGAPRQGAWWYARRARNRASAP